MGKDLIHEVLARPCYSEEYFTLLWRLNGRFGVYGL